MKRSMALEGVRVVTVEDFLALPWGTMQLSDMGAEVIRVESHTRLNSRRWAPFPENDPGQQWWNRSGTHTIWYRNKKSLTLDLSKPQGVELFKRLVRVADVVTENNRPGVMDRLGLGYQALKEVKPDLIMISSSGFGGTGPWRNYGAFARTIDALCGLSHLTGYEGGPPVRGNPSYMDITAGWHNALLVLVALHHRRTSGKGMHIDLSMYETGVTCIGEAILDVQMNTPTEERLGNGHRWKAPHGCYPCSGNDRWVVIAVETDEEWRSLVKAMDNPQWAADERFADALSRWKSRKTLDQRLSEWTSARDQREVMHLLQEAGVPAGAVLDARGLLTDPHLRQRGYFDLLARPPEIDGVGARPYVGRPYRLSRTPGSIRGVSTLGQDNPAVLEDLLGLSGPEVEELIRESIIGTEPIESQATPPPVVPLEAQVGRGAIYGYDTNYKEVLGLE